MTTSPDADDYNYHDSYWRCGRADKCGLPAGWGTDHVGTGACKLHGGSGGRPLENGIYSDVVREKDRAVLDALEDLSTAQKLDETLNLQVMKLRRAVELTANPDQQADFWATFSDLVDAAGQGGELDGKQIRSLARMLETPGKSQRHLMDLIRKTAKTLHDITEGQDINLQHGVDEDAIAELQQLAEDAYD